MLKEMEIAGIRIFRFAIKGDEINEHYADVNSYPENCVAYTTTHDTETLLSYIQSLTHEQKQKLADYTEVSYESDKDLTKKLRNAVVHSSAKTVIIPMQDWLLTTDRINIPGTEKEINDLNWQFKLGCPVEELPTDFTV